ncbi:MAG: 1-acyl-sn-glycerol-3-phosphate acyltransferase [Candidatus Izimaplasma sp.]|nr:1-acyl-sn-glycerol-3-phosphate acyltransferase [Candidatus Izimaplasma bacterium]
MKKRRKDIIQDILLKLIIPFVHIWMLFDVKTKKIYKKPFTKYRKKPYVLLANHSFLFDVIHVPLGLKKLPFIIASHNLYSQQPTKFLLKYIAHTIPKTKGKGDIRAAKELIGAVKRGYPIVIFPEGDTTYTGETRYIEESTYKLIKKLKIDVVACNVKGGYLSRPRWAKTKRRNKKAKLTYEIIMTKEELKDLSLEEISSKVKRGLYNNDYDYQRDVMIPHPSKDITNGLTDLLYICPHCNGVNTLETNKEKIRCTKCDKEGHMDEYGFIHGFKFDNLVDWDAYQIAHDNLLEGQVVKSCGKMLLADNKTQKRQKLGYVQVELDDTTLKIKGEYNKSFNVTEINNPVITLRRNFNFYYNDQHYFIKLDENTHAVLRKLQSKY